MTVALSLRYASAHGRHREYGRLLEMVARTEARPRSRQDTPTAPATKLTNWIEARLAQLVAVAEAGEGGPNAPAVSAARQGRIEVLQQAARFLGQLASAGEVVALDRCAVVWRAQLAESTATRRSILRALRTQASLHRAIA